MSNNNALWRLWQAGPGRNKAKQSQLLNRRQKPRIRTSRGWAQRKGRPQRTGRPGPFLKKITLIAQAEIQASARHYSLLSLFRSQTIYHIRWQRSIGSHFPPARHNIRPVCLFRSSLLQPARHSTAWDRESDRASGSSPSRPDQQRIIWGTWPNQPSSGIRLHCLLPDSLLPASRYRTRRARYSRSRRAKPSQPTGQLQHQQR